jgi:hypothetical protein
MAISVIPTPSAGGGIKAVQRGNAVAAGTVTITAVDTTKAFVNVFGTASSGTVGGTAAVAAANGSTSGYSGNANASNISSYYYGPQNAIPVNAPSANTTKTSPMNGSSYNANGMNVSLNAQSLSGGTNNLVAAVVQGYLSGSTSLVVSGACRWEVVEFA